MSADIAEVAFFTPALSLLPANNKAKPAASVRRAMAVGHYRMPRGLQCRRNEPAGRPSIPASSLNLRGNKRATCDASCSHHTGDTKAKTYIAGRRSSEQGVLCLLPSKSACPSVYRRRADVFRNGCRWPYCIAADCRCSNTSRIARLTARLQTKTLLRHCRHQACLGPSELCRAGCSTTGLESQRYPERLGPKGHISC